MARVSVLSSEMSFLLRQPNASKAAAEASDQHSDTSDRASSPSPLPPFPFERPMPATAPDESRLHSDNTLHSDATDAASSSWEHVVLCVPAVGGDGSSARASARVASARASSSRFGRSCVEILSYCSRPRTHAHRPAHAADLNLMASYEKLGWLM